MIELQLSGVSHTLQTVVFASVIFAILCFLPRINIEANIRKIPEYVYGKGSKKRSTYIKSARQLYQDGYSKFKDQVWRISTTESIDTIVIPPKFLPELRKLGDDIVSFPKQIDETMHTKYTKLDTDASISAHVVKADLTPALARLNPVICAETEEAVKEEMPPCEDWTPVYIYMKLVSAIAKISGRVFVGPELCRNQEYLDAGINYTMDVIAAQRKIQDMKPWLRPFLAPRLKEVHALSMREEQSRKLLEPIVRARLAAQKEQGKDYEKPDDVLQWLLNRSLAVNHVDVAHLAKTQLGLIFAAIHTTSLTATNILYSLAVTPEYIQPLRDEIRKALNDHDGVITYKALQEMEKLDSYMKEVMRFYPPGFTSFTRKVMRGFTLSNGQYIPAGVSIEVPSHAIYQDDSNYPNGSEFDGFRAYKLRQQGGATNHARNQFVTTNEVNLAFGYGRHACPGRFFAANEIKMILARVILEYDFKNLDGETGLEKRYPNHENGRGTNPDASRQLLFKKVTA